MTKTELKALIREAIEDELQSDDNNLTGDVTALSKDKMTREKLGQKFITLGKQLRSGEGKGLEPVESALLSDLVDKLLARANDKNATSILKRVTNLVK